MEPVDDPIEGSHTARRRRSWSDDPTQDDAVTVQLHRLSLLLLNEYPRYNLREVAERAEVGLEKCVELVRTLGFATPDFADPIYTEADVAALRVAAGVQQANLRLDRPFARALGHSMARMTEWQADLLVGLASERHAEQAAAGLSDDQPVEAVLAELLPTWEKLQQHVWRRHLIAAVEHLLTSQQSVGVGADALTVVGFADIAQYTSTSRGLSAQRLAEFVEKFTSVSSLVVTDHGGRVIKTIGDEVMFAVEDVASGAAIALRLAGRINELDGRPDLHVGLAYGTVTRHLGDYYGPVVNLASRLTSLARPGTVLVDAAMAEALVDNLRVQVHPLSSVALRGFSALQPWLLRSRG